MADDPSAPDRDPNDTVEDQGDEFAPTMAMDVSEVEGFGAPTQRDEPPTGALDGPTVRDESPAEQDEDVEATIPLDAAAAEALLRDLDAQSADGGESSGAASASGAQDVDVKRQTMVEAPEHIQSLLSGIQAQAKAISSPEQTAKPLSPEATLPAGTGSPLASLSPEETASAGTAPTVAEKAVPVADSFRTGANPAAPVSPDDVMPSGPHTAPNPALDGPGTQPNPAIPKTMAAPQIDATTPQGPDTARDQALAMVGDDDDSKTLLYLIIGVAVLIVLVVVGIIVAIAL